MSGLSRFSQRFDAQPREAGYVARDRSANALPECQDPGTLALARAIACAIREARPVVTLPPHIYIPWRAKPFHNESRLILDATAGSFDAGAVFAADGEGIPTPVVETTEFSTLASFTVPQGHVAVLRRWAAQPDLLGYVQDTDGISVVRLRLNLGGTLTFNGPSLLGLLGTLDAPFDVSYVIPERQTIAIEGLSADSTMWHFVESFVEGYVIQSSDVFGDSMDAILEKCP